MQFYSVVARQNIEIPNFQVRQETRNGRVFFVGKYTYNGQQYEAWKVKGMAGQNSFML